MRVLLTNLAVLLLAETASALQLSSAIATCRAPALRRSTTPQLSLSPEDEPNPEDASEYSVDWDTAWSKEISSREEGTQQWRPEGREAVTEQQLATARATKAMDDASFNMQMAATVRDHGPLFLSLFVLTRALLCHTQDWRFWIAILAVLSIGTALIGHQDQPQTYAI